MLSNRLKISVLLMLGVLSGCETKTIIVNQPIKVDSYLLEPCKFEELEEMPVDSTLPPTVALSISIQNIGILGPCAIRGNALIDVVKKHTE